MMGFITNACHYCVLFSVAASLMMPQFLAWFWRIFLALK